MTLTKTENVGAQKLLPGGWRWARLGEICEFAYGSSLPEIGRKKGTIPVYGSNGIVGYHDDSITHGPTLVIGRKGSIGEVNYSNVPCWPIDTTYYIDDSKTSCRLDWLFFLLKFIKLSTLNKASGVPGLNRDDAYNELIPLPPLAEQKRISQILKEQMAAVEKARAAAEARLEAAKALPAAYLREIFDSAEAKEWSIKRCADCLDVRDGTHDTPKYVNQGIPLVTSKNLKPYGIDFDNVFLISHEDYEQIKKRSGVIKGDILYAMIGTIGNPVIVDTEREFAIKNVALFKFDDSPIEPEFFYFLLQSPIVAKQINMATQGGIQKFASLTVLRDLSIPVPSPLEQKFIVAKLKEKISMIENLIKNCEEQLMAVNGLPSALLHQAFSGGL